MFILTLFDHDIQKERLVEMENEQHPHESDSVLGVQGLQLPVDIAEGVLEESGNVLVGSPLLRHITGLS